MSLDGSWGADGEDFSLLPTEELLRLGNMNPMGLPFLRHRTGQDVERASLTGSHSNVEEDDACDEPISASLVRSSTTYGSLKSPDEGITLTWRDLSVYVPQSRAWWKRSRDHKPFKRVLNNVSGAVRPGTLVALMGSSGAGKSTLMNALAHRTPSGVIVDGEILINGRPVDKLMTNLVGYVHQDDLFVGSLSVKEHLTFMARLRMDKTATKFERNTRVAELMRELGLTKAANTRIGIQGLDKSISGGERKRLAFASEILTDPPMLFCDEPTTGLDSFNARKLVKILKDMASRGKTILCTIHQPSSELFAMFDRLLLIAEGRIAFLGNSSEALDFFASLGHKCPSTFNPADYYIHTLAVLPGHEVTSRDRIKRICDNFAVSEQAKEVEGTIRKQDNLAIACEDADEYIEPIYVNAPRKPGWPVQLNWLLWRSFVDSYRNPAIHSIRVLQKIIIAVTIGLCYSNVVLNQAGIQDIEGVLFVFLTENTFPSLFGVLNIFPQELPVFLREHKNGIYGTGPYYVSKMVALIPGFIVDPVVFCCICYWMVGLQRSVYHFSMTVFTIIVTANVSSACGAMFSAMFESIPFIMLFLIPFDVILMVSGGLFIKIDTLAPWIGWVRYLSWFLYSNEALTVTQWEGVTNITCDVRPEVPCISTGDEVISNFGFSPSHLPLDFSYMLALYGVFHVMGYVGLSLRASRK